MKLKYVLAIFCLAYILNSCQKQPVAKFTTDKDYYTAGDTVHLKDASVDAYSWKWTTPDGGIFTTQNLDYPINVNDCNEILNFGLEITSKNGKKKSFTIRPVNVSSAILPSDYFFITGLSANYKPTSKRAYIDNGKWVIEFKEKSGSNGMFWTSGVAIYFSHQPTTTMEYVVQTNLLPLLTGQVYLAYYSNNPAGGSSVFYSESGQFEVVITKNSSIRVVFGNVVFKNSNNNSQKVISGDITVCP